METPKPSVKASFLCIFALRILIAIRLILILIHLFSAFKKGHCLKAALHIKTTNI